MTLKTITGKRPNLYKAGKKRLNPEESTNKTPRKATCLKLSLKDQPIKSVITVPE